MQQLIKHHTVPYLLTYSPYALILSFLMAPSCLHSSLSPVYVQPLLPMHDDSFSSFTTTMLHKPSPENHGTV